MRKNLSVLAATAFFSGIYQSMVQVVWQPYALSLGVSIPTLGLLNSLGGFSGLVTAVVQPVGGWLSDQAGHKRLVVAGSIVAMASLGFYYWAGWTGQWLLLVVAVALMGASALARPARGALVAESSDRASHGSAYSLVFVASVLPGIFAPVLGGYVAELAGRKTVFLVGIVFEVISLAMIVGWLREPRLITSVQITWSRLVGLFKRIIPPSHLMPFFLCIAGDSFVWGTGFGLLFGILSKDYKYTDAQLGVLSSALAAVMVLAQIPLGRFIDRYGAKPSLVLSEALGVPLMIIWLTQTSFEWFVASFAVFGLVAATWGPAVMTYLAAHAPAGARSEAIGQLSAFRGLVSFMAPALGGRLYEWGGFRAPIMFNLVGVVILMFALAIFLKEDRTNRAVNE